MSNILRNFEKGGRVLTAAFVLATGATACTEPAVKPETTTATEETQPPKPDVKGISLKRSDLVSHLDSKGGVLVFPGVGVKSTPEKVMYIRPMVEKDKRILVCTKIGTRAVLPQDQYQSSFGVLLPNGMETTTQSGLELYSRDSQVNDALRQGKMVLDCVNRDDGQPSVTPDGVATFNIGSRVYSFAQKVTDPGNGPAREAFLNPL